MFLFSNRWLKSKMELRVAKRSGISSGILRPTSAVADFGRRRPKPTKPSSVKATEGSLCPYLYKATLRGIRRRRTKIRPYGSAELIVWIVVAICFLPTHPAHAYIDPGSGSLIIQILVGAFFGAAYLVKRFWNNIVSLFRRQKKDK